MYSVKELKHQYEERHACWSRAFARSAGITLLPYTKQTRKGISQRDFERTSSALESQLSCIKGGLPKARIGESSIDLDAAVDNAGKHLRELATSNDETHVQYVQDKKVEYEQLRDKTLGFTSLRFRGFDTKGSYIEVPFNSKAYQVAGMLDRYLILQQAFDQDSNWINNSKFQEWIDKLGLKETALIVKEQMDNGKRFPF